MKTFIREKPFVDVILPNYNKAKFLEEAVYSVINLTYKNWHLATECLRDLRPGKKKVT